MYLSKLNKNKTYILFVILFAQSNVAEAHWFSRNNNKVEEFTESNIPGISRFIPINIDLFIK